MGSVNVPTSWRKVPWELVQWFNIWPSLDPHYTVHTLDEDFSPTMTIRRRGWGLLTDLMSICLSLCLSLSLSLSVCLSHSVSLSHIFCLFVNLSLSVCGGFLPEAKHCVRPMDILKNGQRTEKCPPIHSNENCSMVQGNIKERFDSASWRQPRPSAWRAGGRNILVF